MYSKHALVITAAASCTLALCVVWIRDYIKKQSDLKQFKQDLADKLLFDDGNTSDTENLMKEQLSRNIAFLGEAGVDKCRSSFVVVVGLGGVGSHAAHMLARSGIGRIRLIDFDQVTLSSLNRHAVAKRSDVGTFKVFAMKKHLHDVVPHAIIETFVDMFKKESAPILLAGNPDYVLDCIDNLETKVDLLEYCQKNKIPVISSMGAGAKADASRIQIADVSETSEDPLARSTRRALRMRGIDSGITVVYSTEKPSNIQLLPLSDSQIDEAHDYAPLPHFRSRILPVLGTIPALFGNAMASFVITKIAAFPTDPLPMKHRRKVFEKYYNDFVRSENVARNVLKITVDDVWFIYEDIWNCKSAINEIAGEKLVLLRWDKSNPAELGNLIFATKDEANAHKTIPTKDLEVYYDEATVKRIKDKLLRQKKAFLH